MAELIIFCFVFLFIFLPAAVIAGVAERIESKRIEGRKKNGKCNAGKWHDRRGRTV